MFAQWLGPGVASVSWGWQALSKEHTCCPRLSLIWAREVPCSMRNISLSSCSCSRVSSWNAYQKLLVCNRREVGCALHLVLATRSLPGSVPLLMFLCVLLAPIPCAIPHPSQMLTFQGPQSPVAENCGPCGLVVCFARTRPQMG